MNPYAAPQPVAGFPHPAQDVALPRLVLASLGKRFTGSLIDTALQVASAYALMYAWMAVTGAAKSSWLLYAFLVSTHLVQAVLLATRGQTLGKMAVRTRIVLVDGRPAPFVNTVVLRLLPLLAVGFVGKLYPALGMITGLVSLADGAAIFHAQARRTVHDRIAGTVVVDV